MPELVTLRLLAPHLGLKVSDLTLETEPSPQPAEAESEALGQWVAGRFDLLDPPEQFVILKIIHVSLGKTRDRRQRRGSPPPGMPERRGEFMIRAIKSLTPPHVDDSMELARQPSRKRKERDE